MNVDGVLKQLFSAYPNSEVSPATVAVYMRLLRDIPAAQLQTVVDQAIATCKFLPTVAELRDMYAALGNGDRLTWADAWQLVVKEIRRIGSYGVPHFDDDMTQRTVAAMGWRELCLSENQAVDRAQFRDMYNAMQQRTDNNTKMLPQARELANLLSMNGRKLLGANNAKRN